MTGTWPHPNVPVGKTSSSSCGTVRRRKCSVGPPWVGVTNHHIFVLWTFRSTPSAGGICVVASIYLRSPLAVLASGCAKLWPRLRVSVMASCALQNQYDKQVPSAPAPLPWQPDTSFLSPALSPSPHHHHPTYALKAFEFLALDCNETLMQSSCVHFCIEFILATRRNPGTSRPKRLRRSLLRSMVLDWNASSNRLSHTSRDRLLAISFSIKFWARRTVCSWNHLWSRKSRLTDIGALTRSAGIKSSPPTWKWKRRQRWNEGHSSPSRVLRQRKRIAKWIES